METGNSLLQARIKAAQDVRRDVVEVDSGHARELRVVAGHVGVQEIVQLRGKLDTCRASANNAEVQELAPVRVCNCWLVRLFEAWIYAQFYG